MITRHRAGTDHTAPWRSRQAVGAVESRVINKRSKLNGYGQVPHLI